MISPVLPRLLVLCHPRFLHLLERQPTSAAALSQPALARLMLGAFGALVVALAAQHALEAINQPAPGAPELLLPR